ncbi:TPA: hypothetical protein I3599_000493 [Enterobacter cloacae]|nr:hypothetical protein [Enterobacter cloacae]
MKKLLVLLAFPLFAQANEYEVKTDQAKLVQAACSSLMRDVMQQYGKSFFCKTSNAMAESANASLLVENTTPNATGHLIRFTDVFNDASGNIHYSYNVSDYNQAINYIKVGGGLTEKQQSHQVCRSTINTMKNNAADTDKKYIKKEISQKEYDAIHKFQMNAISNMEKQCPNGIVLG